MEKEIPGLNRLNRREKKVYFARLLSDVNIPKDRELAERLLQGFSEQLPPKAQEIAPFLARELAELLPFDEGNYKRRLKQILSLKFDDDGVGDALRSLDFDPSLYVRKTLDYNPYTDHWNLADNLLHNGCNHIGTAIVLKENGFSAYRISQALHSLHTYSPAEIGEALKKAGFGKGKTALAMGFALGPLPMDAEKPVLSPLNVLLGWGLHPFKTASAVLSHLVRSESNSSIFKRAMEKLRKARGKP